LVRDSVYTSYASELDAEKLRDAERDPEARVLRRNGKVIGVLDAAGTPRAGFPTPSGRIEISAAFLRDWGWPEYVDPGYIESHVHERHLDRAAAEFVLDSTFRLPTLVHTRSANSKWLSELSNTNPVWIHPNDAERLGVATGDLVRVATSIGYYVNRAWVT